MSEIDTQIEIAQNLNYLSQENFHSLQTDLVEIQMLLGGLIRSLK